MATLAERVAERIKTLLDASTKNAMAYAAAVLELERRRIAFALGHAVTIEDVVASSAAVDRLSRVRDEIVLAIARLSTIPAGETPPAMEPTGEN